MRGPLKPPLSYRVPVVVRPPVVQRAPAGMGPMQGRGVESRPAPAVFRPAAVSQPFQNPLGAKAAAPAGALQGRGVESRPAPAVYKPGAVSQPFRAAGLGTVRPQAQSVQRQPTPHVPVVQPQVVYAPVVQPKVLIKELGNKTLPPTGKDSKVIWADLKSDLLDEKLAYHGLNTRYYNKILRDDTVRRFDTQEEFRDWFTKKMLKRYQAEEEQAQEEERQKVPKKQRAKRTVRKFNLSRPAWPDDYREKLGAQRGQDLRHVVRNATLKKSLLVEQSAAEETWGREECIKYFTEMANELGVFAFGHYAEIVRAIYHKVYLHVGNLFAEAGGVNQAIGFLADPITNKGIELRALGDKPVDPDVIMKFIESNIASQIKSNRTKAEKLRVKCGDETADTFLKGLDGYEENLKKFLSNLFDLWMSEYAYALDESTRVWVDAWDIAEDLIDIGDNFGFDLILADSETSNVAIRQQTLIQVEMKLQSRDWKPLTHELTAILKTFLSVPGHETKPKPKPTSRSQRAGLQFPVGRINRLMKEKRVSSRVAYSAPIYMAAVLEYLTAEILELAGDQAKGSKSKRILPKHITLAIKNDEELVKLGLIKKDK